MKTKLLSLSPLLISIGITGAMLLTDHSSTLAQSSPTPTPLVAAVTIARSSDQAAYVMESPERSMSLNSAEAATLLVQLSAGTGVVRLRTTEGGLLNGQRQLDFDTDQVGRTLSFTFDPGSDNGVFYVEISDSRTSEVITEFRVGAPLPKGQPGPALSFN